MRRHIERCLYLTIVNLVPNALFVPVHNHISDPMSGGIINAVAPVRIAAHITLGVTKRDGNLAERAIFRNIEDRFLMLCLNGLNPSRVNKSIITNLIPCRIEWVAIAFVTFSFTANIHNLVAPEELYLPGIKERLAKEFNAAFRHTSLNGCWSSKDARKAQVCQK